MSAISLLDCTLRDGGYVNDWNFGHDNLISIFERLVSAGVDFIELGFIDEHRPFDFNRSIAPDTESFSQIFGGLDKRGSLLVGMIDYGTCSIENIQPCRDTIFDGIRVIFEKHVREQAIDFCKQLKDLGYRVFVQLVSITSYNDDELNDLICLANELEPYAVSMVDTYGLLQQENLMHYYSELNSKLNPNISLGYHSHNNFQRAFANCVEMLSQKTDRKLLVDATIYGMGKSAGNCPLELLAMYLNEQFQKHYDLSQILEALDASIMEFYMEKAWGYNMLFYISALNNCHPAYVTDLMEKKTLSVKQINEVLANLKDYGDKQLLYDRELGEKLYCDYQKQIHVDDERDIEKLKGIFSGKDILLLGPGRSIEREKERIQKYINEKKPIVISINYISNDLHTDYVFLSNAKRYAQISSALLKKKGAIHVIATSNVTAMNADKFEYSLDVFPLLDEGAEIIDNSFLMLLKVMIRLGVKKVALGGFDGYVGEKLADMRLQIEMNFITDSLYISEQDYF